MPNIVEYTSKSSLNPSDKGINAAEQAAVVYQRTGNKIAGDIRDIADTVERHMAVMETSELYKTGTELKMNLHKRYIEESALPENRNDPTFSDRFMAEVGPLIEEWGKGAGTEHGKQLAVQLGGSIRNEVFNYVSAGQAEMDSAHVEDNLTQTINNIASTVVTDPSEINLRRALGTADAAIQGMTATIPDVSMRENAASAFNSRARSAIVMERYVAGVGEAIKNQIAETGGETSPATEQLDKDIANKLGFEFLSPEQQTRIMGLKEQAVSQGQELFNSRHATAKAQAVEQGKASYAELHNQLTNLALQGLPPTPELVAKIQQYSMTYGATNPGESASLDSALLSNADRAQRNAVQPFDQNVRDRIQAGFSLPPGDPRRPTLASLMQAYSHGQITKEDLSGYTEILGKLDKPQDDPAFKAAWENFVRWRTAQADSIGMPNAPGTAAARSRFINDVTNNFMARGKAGGDWDRAYERVTNPNEKGSFANPIILDVYRKAARRPDAGAFLNSRWPQWNPNDNTLTWPSGTGGGRPAAPAVAAPPPAKPVTPAADLQKADEILWGKK